VEGKTQAVNMKKWKGVAENVSFGDLPNLDDIPRILDQILLGEDRSLGLTRRPRGVDEESRIVEVSPRRGCPVKRGWK
jgi:hypothetical protein